MIDVTLICDGDDCKRQAHIVLDYNEGGDGWYYPKAEREFEPVADADFVNQSLVLCPGCRYRFGVDRCGELVEFAVADLN